MAFALCASVAAQAEEDHVGPPAAECKEVAERLIEATGAEIDRWTPSGYRVFFKSPEMLFDCDPDYPLNRGLQMASQTADFPSDAWFREVATAGSAVTGVDIQEVEASTRQCHRAALDSETRNASKDLPNNKIVECSGRFLKNGYETVKFYSEDD
jgi:hypothetical protein